MPEGQAFIPKTSVARLPYKKAGVGLLGNLSIIIFILSLLFVFGLFFYRGYLQSQITTLADNLKKVESDFEPSLILELQKTSQSLNSTQNLLNKHPALSGLFDFLEKNTIPNVRFLGFSYNNGEAQMSGVARSYGALAQQSMIFEKSRLIKDVSFSNFSLTSEGFVNFSLNFKVEPELISFKTSVN
ncbi:MAG: hypothetical protein HYW09_01505 [Candidatus Niyogibacteria bacterium]|nr:hypothetical protein [Candidatus Niyogibacteria bacterium]